MSKLTLAIPSKGRLMEQTTDMFARAGLVVRKVGHVRGYRGEIEGLPGVDVAYVSSSEIAAALKSGSVHLGITGEDLICENISDKISAQPRFRFRRYRGRSSDLLDRCLDGGGARRNRHSLQAQAWPLAEGRNKVYQYHPALLRREGVRRLPYHRERGRD